MQNISNNNQSMNGTHMPNETALVITSISKPNAVLNSYAEQCKGRDISFIVIGDVSSPPEFFIDGCEFFNIESQRNTGFKLAQVLPERHYARKNLGYLVAMNRGKRIIIETDDDNFPKEGFWKQRRSVQEGCIIEDAGWLNIYSYFTDNHIWPRGFPLEYLRKPYRPLTGRLESVFCPIQQGLADDNPDVDAVYRMTMPLPQSFNKPAKVALGKNSWSPFNSQNTTWFPEVFPLMYLPSFCSFRMTDIWRSFVAQRICWANDWKILFHGSTVRQERNEHNLLKDFSEEIPGLLNNARICETLAELSLESGISSLSENLLKCYRSLIALGVINERELVLLDAWLEDMG